MKKTGKIIICKICGKEKYYAAWALKRSPKFCSQSCASIYKFTGERNPNWKGGKIKMNCLICNKEFYRKPYEKTNKFCSHKCAGIYQSNHPHKPKTGIYKNCLICNKSFYVRKHNIVRKKYCSFICRNKGLVGRKPGNTKYILGKCLICNKEIRIIPSHKRKFCSKKCKNIFQKGKSWNAKNQFQKAPWKFSGTRNEYRNLHKRINRKFGKSDRCEHCGKSGLTGKQIHWANKKDSKYTENRKDWIRLCVGCHFIYDRRRPISMVNKTLQEPESYTSSNP